LVKKKDRYLKILIITQYFYPENFRINDLVEELSNRNHEIKVLTGMPNYPNGRYFKGYNLFSIGRSKVGKIKIVRAPLIPRYSGKGWQLLLNYFSFAFFSTMFLSFFFNEKFDLIFVYEPSPITVGIPAVLFKKIKKIPIIFWVQDLWPESIEAAGLIKSDIILRPISVIVKWIYRNCNIILIQSKGFIKPVINSGADKSKIEYVPNWAENFYKPNLKDKNIYLSLPKKGFNIMFAGNIGVAQSIDTIIFSAQELKNYNINWIIIGNGRKKNYFISEINKLKLEDKFYFIDQKPPQQMPYYFNYADVLLVTLLSKPIFAYTIPGKIQSYLACGKPIIGSLDGEGANIILESNSGLAVNAEDYKLLSAAVIKLKVMPKKDLNQMGINALKYYQNNFDRKEVINKIEKLMESQLNQDE